MARRRPNFDWPVDDPSVHGASGQPGREAPDSINDAAKTHALSATPPGDTLLKSLCRRGSQPFGCQRHIHSFRLSNRPDAVQPAQKTFGNKGGTLGQFQSVLEAVEARQTFPQDVGRNRHPLAKQLPTLGFGPQHEASGKRHVQIMLPRAPVPRDIAPCVATALPRSRVRCTDDGVEGRIVWANGTSVKIQWDDGEQVTWRRDALASKPIDILDSAAARNESPSTEASAEVSDSEQNVATELPETNPQQMPGRVVQDPMTGAFAASAPQAQEQRQVATEVFVSEPVSLTTERREDAPADRAPTSSAPAKPKRQRKAVERWWV
jgi:hypothetical protein